MNELLLFTIIIFTIALLFGVALVACIYAMVSVANPDIKAKSKKERKK